ncbi:MAG: hypothetical protein ACMVO3_15210 [Thalassobaculum sp.]
MRSTLNALGLGDVSLQEFGSDRDVLIRIQRQEGEEAEQIKAIEIVRDALPSDVEFRRTEFVGPTVGAGADRSRCVGGRPRPGVDPGLHLVPVRMAVRCRRHCRPEP